MNSFVLAQFPDQPSSLVRVTVWCLTGNQRWHPRLSSSPHHAAPTYGSTNVTVQVAPNAVLNITSGWMQKPPHVCNWMRNGKQGSGMETAWRGTQGSSTGKDHKSEATS